MKPDLSTSEQSDSHLPAPITGDAIGDTAYSERFVLKLLLKFANLDTLKDEIKDKSFEDDLCTLWDMTSERDVVEFLQKHKVINLFYFALPTIDIPRILEIVIGIIGNMCCHRDVVVELLNIAGFVDNVLQYVTSDDGLVVIQVLRMVNSSLFLTKQEEIPKWIELFQMVDYSSALFFILKNASNKDLLLNALENFNTVSSYCNTIASRKDFFEQFVKSEAIQSLSTAFIELMVTQKDSCERHEIERVLVISLQIILNLIGFEESADIFAPIKNEINSIIEFILNYYTKKIQDSKEIDTDLTDVIDSTNMIVNTLSLSIDCVPEKFFVQSYSMWKALRLAMNSEQQNGSSGFEEQDEEQLKSFSKAIEAPLGILICGYLEKCPENYLQDIIDLIGSDLEEILESITDLNVKAAVTKRTANYQVRLNVPC